MIDFLRSDGVQILTMMCLGFVMMAYYGLKSMFCVDTDPSLV